MSGRRQLALVRFLVAPRQFTADLPGRQARAGPRGIVRGRARLGRVAADGVGCGIRLGERKKERLPMAKDRDWVDHANVAANAVQTAELDSLNSKMRQVNKRKQRHANALGGAYSTLFAANTASVTHYLATTENIMKNISSLRQTLTIGLTCLALLVGCGDNPERARERLARLNIKFPDDFMKCVINNDDLAVRLFLEANINPNQQDTKGWSPLMKYALEGNLEIVQQLLAHGADVFTKGNNEDSPRASILAYQKGFSEVARVLREAERKALGAVPGTYREEDTKEGEQVRWEFGSDGSVQSFAYGHRDSIMINELVSVGILDGLSSLANKLKQPSDPISVFLKKRLSAQTLNALTEYQGSNSSAESLRTALTADLNHIVEGESIYEVQRFTGVSLRPETLSLAEKSNVDHIKLNRKLLEDAYPLEVAQRELEYTGTYRVDGNRIFLKVRDPLSRNWFNWRWPVVPDGIENAGSKLVKLK